MNAVILIAAVLFLAALQARLPALGWLGGIRLEFLPALVAYGALTFRRRSWAMGLALAAGLAQDALSAAPFGLSAIGYLTACLLLTGITRAFDREAFWMQMLGGALASVAVSLGALITLGFSRYGVLKMVWLALISLVLTPVLFGLLDAVRWRTRRA
jgi:rod shape-determining protein MreD